VVSGSLAVTAGLAEAIGITLIIGEVLIGPVGWIVASIAAVVAGGAAVMGREKLKEGRQKIKDRLKGTRWPGRALQLVFRKARYQRLVAEGRVKCEQAVQESLLNAFEPIASQLADHVWQGLRPVIGDMQRPRVEEEADVKVPNLG
jgi:hypothetical protein